MLGVLGLVGVVIQSDEVETGLQLVAASSEHMLPAYALSRLRVTAAEVDVFVLDMTQSKFSILNVPLQLTYCSERRRGRSHTACSRPCHWTGPSAPPTGKEARVAVCVFVVQMRRPFDSGSSPHTGRRRIPPRGACRSSFLCLSHRGFLEAACPVGYMYMLQKNTHSFMHPSHSG